MKRHAFLLIGLFMAVIMAVFFAACEKDNSATGGGGGENPSSSKLVGKWKYSYSDHYGTNTIVATFKSDNTGSIKMSVAGEGTYSYNIYYTYDEDLEVLTIKMRFVEDGYEEYETMKYQLTWYGKDKLFARDTYYGNGEEMGPFVRQ